MTLLKKNCFSHDVVLNPIKNVHDNGLIELVLMKTDAGDGMVVRIIRRNKKEIEK